MSLNIKLESYPVTPYSLREYSEIPIKYLVSSRIKVTLTNGGLGGMILDSEPVKPYVKDYDSLGGSTPAEWPKRFDTSKWRLFLIRKDSVPAAGAVVAFDTPDLRMLDNRRDLALLWDLRVHPDFRRCGLGSILFQEAVKWSRSKNCTQLKVETQNTNVPACRFYAALGCRLGEFHRYKYVRDSRTRDEIMLVWYLGLNK